MKKRIVTSVLAAVLAFGTLPAYAYTPGPLDYEMPINAGITDGRENASDTAVNLSPGKLVGYSITMPFDSDSVTVKYTSDASGRLVFFENGFSSEAEISPGTGEVKCELVHIIAAGDIDFKISSDTNISISGITFGKTDSVYQESYKVIPVDYTDYEEKTLGSVIFSEKASVYMKGGGIHYINADNKKETPIYINEKLYVPAKTIADSMDYYIEEYSGKDYLLMRKNNTEIIYREGKAIKSIGGSTSSEYESNLVYINSTAYVPIREFAELAGLSCGYRDGIVVADRHTRTRDILSDDDIFKKAAASFDDYIPDSRSGNIYYVSQTWQASDNNPGTAEAPFATLAKAGEEAKAGDTVIIGGGVYRETLAPKNDGEPTRPVVFKAAENEDVVISANEEINQFVDMKDGTYVAAVGWDMGDGKNQVFYKGEAISAARHPDKNTSMHTYPYELKLGELWPTFGNIRTTKADKYKAVSDTDLSGFPKDYWKGGTFVSMHGHGWALGTAKIESSDDGSITLDAENVSKTWWPDSNEYDTDYGYITGTKNAISVPGEWHIENNRLYIMPPEGENTQTLSVEVKKRQLAIDLSDRSFVEINGIKTIGGSARLADTFMCELNGCEMRYISHYTYSKDQRDGYIDTDNKNLSDGAPQRGEVGVYISGKNDIIRNSVFDESAAAGLYLTGCCTTVENCVVSNCGYMGSYVAGISINTEGYKPTSSKSGGHIILRNSLYNSGRAPLNLSAYEERMYSADEASSIMPMTIAYNDIYNGNISARDTGIIYFWGVAVGTDLVKTKIHNNIVHDGWIDDNGREENKHIYFDNYMAMAECYDNITFYSDERHKSDRFGPNIHEAGYWSTDAEKRTTGCAVIDMWNNKILGFRPGGKTSLAQCDYPYEKPFAAGSDIDNGEFLQNYNGVPEDKSAYMAENVESSGAVYNEGMMLFDGSGQHIVFKNVDFADGKGKIELTYALKKFDSGAKISVFIDNIDDNGKSMSLSSEADSMNCLNTVSIKTPTLVGQHDVIIRADDVSKLGIERIRVLYNRISDKYLTHIFGGDGIAVSGNIGYFDTQCAGNDVNQYINNTWPGTVVKYENVLFSHTVDKVFAYAGTMGQWSGGTVKVRVVLPDGEAEAELVTEGNQFSYPTLSEAMLSEAIPPGVYDVYLEFEGLGKTCDYYWTAFGCSDSDM